MRPRFMLASGVALLAALLLATPVAAAPDWEQVFRESGDRAFAVRDDGCVENSNGTTTCSGRAIDVFEGRVQSTGEPTFNGERVCYDRSSHTFRTNTGQFVSSRGVFGCRETSGKVTFDDLASATLKPTVVRLTRFVCNPNGCTESPAGTKTIAGSWDGQGTVTRITSRFRIEEGGCITMDAQTSASRMAAFDGTLDATDARVGTGTFVFKTTCPFEPEP